jgi:hypothetical protein
LLLPNHPQEGDALVKQVTAEMEAMRAQYQSVITELQVRYTAGSS